MVAHLLRLIVLVTILLLVGVAYLGYRFYVSGDNYGLMPGLATADSERLTHSGKVIGFTEANGSHAWLGIPYARPPVGSLRWRSPQPPGSWEGTLQALRAGNSCTQTGSAMESRPPREWGQLIGSEDCLYLNIYAPAFSPEQVPRIPQRLPVMVYIHGGGNHVGYANQFKYSGAELAKDHSVIVVSFNYRLGPLGWFTHPGLNQEGSAEDRSGNFGNLDTMQALAWVQNNIEFFGGDPNNVTVFGHSAGGMNTYVLLASQLSEGLFHKAIVQSGLGPRSMSPGIAQQYSDAPLPQESNSSREVVNRLLQSDGNAADRFQAMSMQEDMSPGELSEYLRAKTSAEFLAVYHQDEVVGFPRAPMLFADGVVIPAGNLADAYADTATYNNVPIILGSTHDEFRMALLGQADLARTKFGFLPEVKDWEFFDAYSGYLNDAIKARGVDEIANAMSAAQQQPVYAYRFDWDELPTIAGFDLARLMGAPHAQEIPFVFQRFDNSLMNQLMFNEDNIPGRDALASSMASYWAEFAYSGSPGKGRKGNLDPWQPWNGDSDGQYIVFDDRRDGGIRMVADPVTSVSLLQRLRSDPYLAGPDARSRMYDCLFRGTQHWNEEEFGAHGGSACNIAIFKALR